MRLTQEKLKQLLYYFPDEGIFIWKVTNGRAKAMNVAGWLRSDGYISIKINGVKYLAHRLAWFYVYGEWPTGFLDHIDRDKTNNRINNLRLATNSQNQMNTGVRCNNTSGVKGVCWKKDRKKWAAHIRLNGKLKCLGAYDNINDAEIAYKNEAKLHFTEFAE